MKEERIPSRHALSRSPGQAYLEYMEEKKKVPDNFNVLISIYPDTYDKYFPNQLLKTYESGALSSDAEKIIANIKSKGKK